MYIESLDFKGFRGSSFRFKFAVGTTCLIGLNGCGKSTTIDLLAALTGHRKADMLVHGESLGYAKVVVHTGTGPKTLEINGWDWEAINTFKDSLPTLASYVLQQENLHDDRLVTERRESVECQQDMLGWLKDHDLGFNRIAVDNAHASMLVSPTGAQVYVLNVGMRRAPANTPMLIEHPERHLHIMLKRRIVRFLKESDLQQAIVSTHCPEVLSDVSDSRRFPHLADQSEGHDKAIGFDEEEIRW